MRHINSRQPGDPRPDRANCRHCGKTIEREPGDDAWTTANAPGLAGRNAQCPAAPNPDDGPMPDHEPAGVIVHPPAA